MQNNNNNSNNWGNNSNNGWNSQPNNLGNQNNQGNPWGQPNNQPNSNNVWGNRQQSNQQNNGWNQQPNSNGWNQQPQNNGNNGWNQQPNTNNGWNQQPNGDNNWNQQPNSFNQSNQAFGKPKKSKGCLIAVLVTLGIAVIITVLIILAVKGIAGKIGETIDGLESKDQVEIVDDLSDFEDSFNTETGEFSSELAKVMKSFNADKRDYSTKQELMISEDDYAYSTVELYVRRLHDDKLNKNLYETTHETRVNGTTEYNTIYYYNDGNKSYVMQETAPDGYSDIGEFIEYPYDKYIEYIDSIGEAEALNDIANPRILTFINKNLDKFNSKSIHDDTTYYTAYMSGSDLSNQTELEGLLYDFVVAMIGSFDSESYTKEVVKNAIKDSDEIDLDVSVRDGKICIIELSSIDFVENYLKAVVDSGCTTMQVNTAVTKKSTDIDINSILNSSDTGAFFSGSIIFRLYEYEDSYPGKSDLPN